MKKILDFKYTIASFVYIFLIWLISCLHPPEMGIVFSWYDKLIHFLVFGLFALIAYGGFNEHTLTADKNRNPRRITAICAISAVTLYGAIDELHQAYIPHRNGDLMDLLFDFLGAFVLVSILHMIRKIAYNKHKLFLGDR